MKKLLLVLLALLSMITGNQAWALPFVAQGSSYSVYFAGDQSNNATLIHTFFDGLPGEATVNGMPVIVNESETALDQNSSHITLHVASSNDLFPSFNENGFVAVGTDGDGLDLLTSVNLYGAMITLSDSSGNIVFASDNIANLAMQNMPWDGLFPAFNDTIGIPNVGGMGITNITFDFYVTTQVSSVVPEPGMLSLCCVGLAGLVATRRRKARNMM